MHPSKPFAKQQTTKYICGERRRRKRKKKLTAMLKVYMCKSFITFRNQCEFICLYICLGKKLHRMENATEGKRYVTPSYIYLYKTSEIMSIYLKFVFNFDLNAVFYFLVAQSLTHTLYFCLLQ